MFVTFEGLDGSGKSTAMRAVAQQLRELGRVVVTTRQPGDSSLNVRAALLQGKAIEPLAELFLFLGDRAQHMSEIIRPALNEGKDVLCDRFADSTTVYQGYARGLDIELLRRLNDLATGGLHPDLTLLFDLEPEKAMGRQPSKDRLDEEPLDFHRRVREGFLSEARLEPERWRIIDARQPPGRVADECMAALRGLLNVQH